MRFALKEAQKSGEYVFIVYQSAPNDPMLCTVESVTTPIWYNPFTWFRNIAVVEKYSVQDGQPLSTSIVRIGEIIEIETNWATDDDTLTLAEKLEMYATRSALNQLWTKDVDILPEDNDED